jgi:hypothetical protein
VDGNRRITGGGDAFKLICGSVLPAEAAALKMYVLSTFLISAG